MDDLEDNQAYDMSGLGGGVVDAPRGRCWRFGNTNLMHVAARTLLPRVERKVDAARERLVSSLRAAVERLFTDPSWLDRACARLRARPREIRAEPRASSPIPRRRSGHALVSNDRSAA